MLVLLGVWALYLAGGLQFIDSKLEDLRFRVLSRPAGSGLVVVAIDARSLRELDVWPWPRRYHAVVARNLAAAGARSVAFDVDFSSVSNPVDDSALEQALSESGVPVFLPVFKQYQQTEQGLSLSLTEPQRRFAQHGELASINVFPAGDGLVREMRTREPWGDGVIATLSARLAGLQGLGPDRFFVDFGIDPSSLPVVSFADVYRGTFDPAQIEGRDVLIGATAIELGDQLPVPVHISLPGVLLHALAVRSLVEGRALRPAGPWPLALFTLLVTLGIGALSPAWSWRRGLLVTATGAALVLAATTAVQLLWPVMIDAAAVVLLLLALFVSGLAGKVSQQDLRLLAQGLSIRRKDAFMRQVVEHSFDGIVTMDGQGVITSCNLSATRMFAYPTEMVVGQSIDRVITADPSSGTAEAIRRRLSTPGGPYELTATRRDGGDFPVNVVVSEMRTDDDPVFIAFVRDLSARKEAEARAEQARNRLQEAIECISEGFVLYDADDRLVLCNSKFRDLLGDGNELFAQGWRFEDVIFSIAGEGRIKDAEGRVDEWIRARLDLHRDPKGPFEQALANGVHLMISERRTHDGGVVGIYTDITDLKLREQSLEAATREAEAASRSKSEFLANMSHELRTPLNAIIGFSEIIEGEAMGPVGVPQYQDYAGDITSSGKHLLGIVNDILDVSRIEAGEYNMNEEEVDLCEITRACIRLVHQRAAEAGHELTVQLPEAPHIVFADERATKQVLINLLGNSIKFTPEAGRITVDLAVNRSGEIEVVVADSGIGIAEEDIPKALAFFGQADSRLARTYEGTGLGLPLARNLIEMQGGRLALQSVLGQGTSVTITFPAERVIAAPAPAQGESLAG